ncbi:hypothetical protein [Streptomyces sp. R35]|uniref:DUF4760 domain-containing protein n=1 Tax=Streptomyces sp. R35 TaxID=3238630 RepID=A0AB39SRL8_9ACTN
MPIGEALTLLGLLLTFLSVGFTGRQLQRSRQTTQAEFLFNITTWFLDDQSVRELYYKLDYATWTFDENAFTGSIDEPHLDKLLYILNLVDQLAESGQINKSGLRILEFEASRVLHNPEVQKYFEWLDKEYRRVGRPGPAYSGARRWSERLRTSGIADGTATTFTSERPSVGS